MKNYFQKILALFTGNDYPGSTRQEFYKWLVDEEHVPKRMKHYKLCGKKDTNQEQLLTCINHTSY